MIPAYVPLPFESYPPVAVWNAYAPRVDEPNEVIARGLNPLYEVPYTNVERAFFYWPEHVVQFYSGEVTSLDVDAILSSM